MYTYYDDGFFGYGPAGTFHPYTLMHFIPILLAAGMVFLVWLERDRLREWKGETRLRFVLSFIMFFTEFSYFCWLLYVGDDSGRYLMMSKMPLHACDLGIISCMYMVPTKNRVLFGINFFVTLFGATLACIIPQTVLNNVGPSYFRYYQYFSEHLIPIVATVYMIIVHEMRPRYRDIWISVGALWIMLVPAFLLNEAYPGSDYMFLKLDIPFMPEDQLQRALIYTVLIILIFHVLWAVWQFLLRRSVRSSGRK